MIDAKKFDINVIQLQYIRNKSKPIKHKNSINNKSIFFIFPTNKSTKNLPSISLFLSTTRSSKTPDLKPKTVTQDWQTPLTCDVRGRWQKGGTSPPKSPFQCNTTHPSFGNGNWWIIPNRSGAGYQQNWYRNWYTGAGGGIRTRV